jgi:hypothetical protein
LLLFFPLSDFIFYRTPTPYELFGFAGGILVGVMICAYLNGFWDPVQLKPLPPDPPQLPWWVRHARLLTILLAATLGVFSRLLFGVAWTRVLAMGGVGIVATVMASFIIRLWWHRPQGR